MPLHGALLQQVRREQQLEEAAGREYKNKTPLTYGQTIQVSRSYHLERMVQHPQVLASDTPIHPSLTPKLYS